MVRFVRGKEKRAPQGHFRTQPLLAWAACEPSSCGEGRRLRNSFQYYGALGSDTLKYGSSFKHSVVTTDVGRGFLDLLGIIRCEKDGGDAELTFIKGLMCSEYKHNLVFLFATVLGGARPILQKEDLRFTKRGNLP